MVTLAKAFITSCLLLLIPVSMQLHAQTIEKKTLSLELAKKIAIRAEAEAKKNNWTMVIAVVDDGGHLIYLERMDGTQIGSIEVATAKARSANDYKRPTKAFEDALAGGRTAILKLPGAMPLEGGIPIMIEGKIVGAIGVSGGMSTQDGEVAKAGLEAVDK